VRSPEEEARAALARYASQRDPRDRAMLMAHYDGLARSLARRACGPNEDLDDLVQVARYGLLQSLERFDPELGFTFMTFAWQTIRGELLRHRRDHSWAVRVPRRTQEAYLRVAAATEALEGELSRPPTIAELADRTGDEETVVIEALDVRAARRGVTLDVRTAQAGPDGGAASAEAAIDDRDLVRSMLGRLPPMDRQIVWLRFFEEQGQADIAKVIGRSQMHVSRALTRSLGRLREMVELELSGVPRRALP
jgi:RNA polymerase sigma-B factor